jgi:hypothetical protein
MHSTPSPSAAPPSTSDLVELADEIFDRTSPYEGDGLRNHCRRLHRLACMLMAKRGVELDSNVAYLIAMVHDLGLVTTQDRGQTYLHRSLALFERETDGWELGGVEPALIRECLLFNHRLLPQRGLQAPADCFRRAVQIEHTHGLARFGLDRREVADVFLQYPRDNFDRVLVDFTLRTLRREPLTLVRGIFF